jgi:hypothetical protein
MSNDVFANYCYGVEIKLTTEQLLTLARLNELEVHADAEDFDSPEEEQEYYDLFKWNDNLAAEVRKKYELDEYFGNIVFVGEAMKGSETDEGTTLFGVGVYAFPSTDFQFMTNVERLKSAGAVWHSWVF